MIDFAEATEVKLLPPLVRDLIGVGYPKALALQWHRARMGTEQSRKRPASSRAVLLKELERGPRTSHELAAKLRLTPENVTMRPRCALAAGLVTREKLRCARCRFAWSLVRGA